ncbi:TPA: hypothetical protein R4057_002030 [Kluyvera ascorbata]|uniref:hypothetical protein n=1 Tax=Kluyvera ascorbata TaxID=51288 RepID=UPI00289F77AC|nr:hypothetical protein [Kluyvera ascorbata]HED3065077.1 hypothetical protein [Kluyvera ascorbata]
MKKIALAFACAALGCAALTACTGNTRYTEVTTANGTTAKHVSIAAGTSATTANGGCINSGDGTCTQQTTTNAATE